MKKFQQIGEWEWAIDNGLLIEIPASTGKQRLAYRTAISNAAWQKCIASITRREQVRRLAQLLADIDCLLDEEPGETEFQFSVFLGIPPDEARLILFCSLNANGHCVMTIGLADGT